MLVKNKKNKNLTDTKNASLKAFTIISRFTVVKGKIDIDDDIRIDGDVVGDIRSKGKVIIGQKGCVNGRINSKSADIGGKMFGNIAVSDTLILRASSCYEGEIKAGSIEMEGGAHFFGNCRMEGKEKAARLTNDINAPDSTGDKSKEVA